MVTRFKVSAEWMQACGKGSEAKVFDVIRIDDYTNKGAAKWCAQMVIVNDNGHEWTVAVGRGELMHMCTACGGHFANGAHMVCEVADSYKDEEPAKETNMPKNHKARLAAVAALIDKAIEELNEIVSDREEYQDNRAETWADTDEGTDYMDFTRELESMRDDLENVQGAWPK